MKTCKCIPDTSGYGWCGECVREHREKIWKEMSEERRNYDRKFAPKQSAELDKTFDGSEEYNTGCSCHINPPCSYCVNKDTKLESLKRPILYST